MASALGGAGGTAYAHTSLSGSSPADGETLETPPEMLHLTFSGKLEATATLHSVALTGPDGAAVPLEPPALDSGGKSLMAALPPLPNGTYDVAFRVISADGHPIEGGFAFEVAAPEPVQEPAVTPAPDAQQPDAQQPEAPLPAPDGGEEEPAAEPGTAPDEADEHAGHDSHGGTPASPSAGAGSAFAALLNASRIAYYASLLPLLGWALWSALRPQVGADRLAYWRRIGMRLQGLHLALFVVHVAVQWAELSGGNPSASFLDTLRSTGTGQSWLFTGLLSLAGFPLLFRSRAVDALWPLFMIAAKTLRGHASAFEPIALARLTDAAHLVAAAIWVGGLLALVLLLRKFPDGFRSFAPTFSTAALASYAVLVVTGVVAALLYTESLGDVVRTTWGWLLIVKAALAVAVLPVAALLRKKLLEAEGRPDAFRAWLRADVALLLGIVVVTGVMTHQSPIVERVVFHWHVMGTEAHLTADIADLREGTNALSLKVWVPEGEAEPAVTVVAVVPGEPDRTASLTAKELPKEEWEHFSGFEDYTFVGDIDVADPAAAELRVRIQRSNGETIDYAKKLIDP
ncbi:copper resistance protein CopC [Paenibacillus sp.]|uniref:copper resistance CopC/CopD family protein n=1 Tax=Paenibacillus sp. TaxID=58172 RepID=UPI00281110A4|nr:copper resistance protein CopC [Paenibacillus sp.]